MYVHTRTHAHTRARTRGRNISSTVNSCTAFIHVVVTLPKGYDNEWLESLATFLFRRSSHFNDLQLAGTWQKQHNDMCAQRRLRSVCGVMSSDQSSLPAWRNFSPLASHKRNSDCSGQPFLCLLYRLIWVITGCTNYFVSFVMPRFKYEPPHDKTNIMTCAPSEDSDQPGYLPSLVRVFTVRSIGSQCPSVSSCGQ